jgi:hypothetical protein
MSPQLNYNEPAAAVKGGLGDSGPNDLFTGVSAVDINFGLGLQIETTGLLAIPSAVGDEVAGIAVQVQKNIPRATGIALYEADEAITMLKKGRIWVYSEQAVNPVLDVFLRHTTTTTEEPGDFRVDIDTDKAIDISAFAKWVSVTTAAGLAQLDINLP